MGLAIYAVNPRGPIPLKTVLELRCDMRHGLFPPPPAIFDCSTGGYAGAHAAAMAAGWLERQEAHVGRVWICPECSGKLAKRVK